MNIPQDKSDCGLHPAVIPELPFKTKDAEMSPAGRKIRLSYLANCRFRTHLTIIATGNIPKLYQ